MIKDVFKWIDLCNKMNEIYGAHTFLDIEIDEDEYDCGPDNIFFICPECGDPIYYNDWSYAEVAHCCPVCDYEWEEF